MEDEMGGTCSVHGGDDKRVLFVWKEWREETARKPNVHERIILKQTSVKECTGTHDRLL
jgi:hypothetical protein